MLTQSEREWLENRKRQSPFGFYSCSHCKANSDPLVCWTVKRCPANIDFKNALEFSERVAAKLADISFCTFRDLNGRHFWNLPEIRLKAARLQVEEEMNANAR